MTQDELDAQKIDWLIEHDDVEDDGQPDDDDGDAAIRDTLQFYVEEDEYDIQDPEFEFYFRAYLHNNDYSYSLKAIRRVIDSVRKSHGR